MSIRQDKIISAIFELLDKKTPFMQKDVCDKMQCSKASVERAIKTIRQEFNIDLNYCRLNKTYVLGTPEIRGRVESNARTYEKHKTKILYKKKLKSIFGESWREHYNEKDLEEA